MHHEPQTPKKLRAEDIPPPPPPPGDLIPKASNKKVTKATKAPKAQAKPVKPNTNKRKPLKRPRKPAAEPRNDVTRWVVFGIWLPILANLWPKM